MDYRWLAAGDERVVRELSERSAELGEGDAESEVDPLSDSAAAAFLANEQNHLLVAFDGERPIGMLLAYELDRRHGDEQMFFIYEVGVDVSRRRQGVGRELLRRASQLARERGIKEAFVLTEESNAPAMALYESEGGFRPVEGEAMFDFDFGGEG